MKEEPSHLFSGLLILAVLLIGLSTITQFGCRSKTAVPEVAVERVSEDAATGNTNAAVSGAGTNAAMSPKH